jgi:plastocyanin
MIKIILKLAVIVSFAIIAQQTAYAGETHVVGQKNKGFTVSHLVIKQGDTVDFKNQDPFFHNIFSLSDVKTFDLGSYPKNESRSVTFSEPGIIEIECAIHPTMHMTIQVEK